MKKNRERKGDNKENCKNWQNNVPKEDKTIKKFVTKAISSTFVPMLLDKECHK